MCPEDNNKETSCCIANLLSIIVALQNRSERFDCTQDGCDKPYLGPIPSNNCYNTRPITLFRCSDGNPWTLPYTLNGTEGTSQVLRVESVDGCCCTCRVLAPNPDTTTAADTPYVGTTSYCTVNLGCVGCLRCLNDTYISAI